MHVEGLGRGAALRRDSARRRNAARAQRCSLRPASLQEAPHALRCAERRPEWEKGTEARASRERNIGYAYEH
eukprot:4787045-Pleurochrysis_carterae.AAC.1